MNPDASEAVKKARTAESGSAVTTQQQQQPKAGLGLNLPLPSAKGKAAIIKVYTSEDSFALNECYEFVGIVSLDPSLAMFPTDGTEVRPSQRQYQPWK